MLTQRKALVLVTLVLLLCALLGRGWANWFQSAVDTLQWPAGWVAASIKADAAVKEENLTDAQLRKQYRDLKAYNLSLWSENEKLREQIKSFNAIGLVTDLEAIRPVQAKVASVNSDPVNPTMKILRGSLAGIKPGDAVAFQTNLIGFVEDVGPVTGTVSLINSPSFRSQVAIMPPNQLRAENTRHRLCKVTAFNGAKISGKQIAIARLVTPPHSPPRHPPRRRRHHFPLLRCVCLIRTAPQRRSA